MNVFNALKGIHFLLVRRLECGVQVGKGFPESLEGLEVGYVRWQPVPIADGPRIK